MPHVIASACVDVQHGRCAVVCPLTCIDGERGVDRMLYIDPAVCIDCRACALECPTGAIHPVEQLPPADRPYAEVNASWYADRAAARARVDALKPRAAGTGPGMLPA